MPDWDFPAAFRRFHAKRPRLAGLLTIVLAGALIAWNHVSETSRDSYYPAVYLVCYPGAFLGLWMAITGRGVIGQRPVAARWDWWLAGAATGAVLALAFGVYSMLRAHA